jgi:hypothetical protein
MPMHPPKDAATAEDEPATQGKIRFGSDSATNSSTERQQGRPPISSDLDTSAAWNFISSMTVLELKSKLNRMRLPCSGTRPQLIEKLVDATGIDENSPMEELPDIVTRIDD